MRPRLTAGQFYGVPQFAGGGADFEIRALAASGAERDVEVHTHEEAHFVLALSGIYISTARGAGELLSPPALIFNPPGTTHRDRFVNGLGTFVAVSLNSTTVRHLRDVLKLASHATLLASAGELAAAFRLVRELRESRDPLVMESLAWELIGAAAAPGRVIDLPSWARTAYEVIMDRATEAGLKIGDVAQQLGVHPVHMARVFRSAWGCTPGELLRWRRVDRAAEMLRRGAASCLQIALDVGFVDQSHMTRAFLATYAVTPGAYRRMHVAPIQAAERPAGVL